MQVLFPHYPVSPWTSYSHASALSPDPYSARASHLAILAGRRAHLAAQVPTRTPEVPAYTPEVVAARAAHLALDEQLSEKQTENFVPHQQHQMLDSPINKGSLFENQEDITTASSYCSSESHLFERQEALEGTLIVHVLFNEDWGSFSSMRVLWHFGC